MADILIFAVLFTAALLVLVTALLNSITPFLDERKYIIMEIHRSSEKSEIMYWKRALKILTLRQIPIIGRLFR